LSIGVSDCEFAAAATKSAKVSKEDQQVLESAGFA
jgi:hypothetical protein